MANITIKKNLRNSRQVIPVSSNAIHYALTFHKIRCFLKSFEDFRRKAQNQLITYLLVSSNTKRASLKNDKRITVCFNVFCIDLWPTFVEKTWDNPLLLYNRLDQILFQWIEIHLLIIFLLVIKVLLIL